MNICKRLLTSMLLIGCMMTFPTDIKAEKGEKMLGISGGYASYNNSGYANVFFQYSFSKHVRIAPEVGYIFKHRDVTGFEASVDMQFPFRVARGIKIYPLAGLTFNAWNGTTNGNLCRGGIDAGGGVDLYLTSNLKLNVQGKYSIMKNTGGAFVNMGIGYVF